MILAVSIDNAHITIGLIDGEDIVSEQLASREMTGFELAMHIHSVLGLYGYGADGIEGTIISSVVPALTGAADSAAVKLTGRAPIIVGPGVKTGLHIVIDDPAELGADLVTQAVGAVGEYPLPLVIVDMDTAASISVIDSKRRYVGGMLLPGMRISMDALRRCTSSLPHVPLGSAPRKVICSNTEDCLRAGAFYGFACAIDGVIDRIAEELGEAPTIVLTGNDAGLISDTLRHDAVLDPVLSLKGLKIIYDKNQ